jgi:small subunit ribosomal protein S18
MPSTKKRQGRRSNKCRFCREMREVDYKDIDTLNKLTSAQGKLFSRKRSGNCARHQRAMKRAVKRARFVALMPYVT